MSRAEPGTVGDLARIQSWMQSVVVHRGTLDEAVAHGEASTSTRPEDVLLASRTLTPAERVGIYHRMFGFRMLGAIGDDVPVLRAVLGEQAFAAFVRAYLEAHPSRSWTLNRASHALADFLPGHPLARERPWLVDLARVERARTLALAAAVAGTLAQDALAEVPADAWDRARLVVTPSLALLDLAHDVEPLLAAHEANEPLPEEVAATPTAMAVWRHHGTRRLVLEPPARALLGALVEGRPLGDALEAAFPRGAEAPEELARLQEWMARFVSGGMFSRVALDD